MFVVSQIESERKAVVRQSSAAILEASADEKLRKAFVDIEDLSRKLADTEVKLQRKVRVANVNYRWKQSKKQETKRGRNVSPTQLMLTNLAFVFMFISF